VLVSAPGAKPVAQGARIAAGMLTTIDAQLMLGLPNSPMVGKQRDSDLQPVDPAAGKPTAANAPEAKVPEAKAPPVAQQGAALTGPPAPLEPYHPEHGMRSTRGGRPLAKGQVNLDLAAGYPYWLNLRAVVGIANERQAALDMLLAYRSALLFHEVQAGGRYRFMGDGPLQLAALVAVGAGGNSGGRNNFSLAAGVAATLVFGDKVALSGRLEVDVWSDLLCGEVVQSADATSDTSKGCQVDKDDKPIDAAADGLTSGGADLRDNGLRLLGGVALEIAISQTTNIFAAVDRRLAGNEKRAGFSSSFNSLMVLDDDPGWLGSAGVSFGF